MTQDIVDLLIRNAQSGGANTRAAALKALGEGAPATEEVINCLKEAAENGGAETRSAALLALGRIFRN
ncbi:HEAT repeat domain-containing protein [Enterobacter roggenkampii]|uniref:HEAT repeat domain-containing protein n=1 Tax=Enterobacter roggenkampii TaxID=1812935 RepID=UPI00190BF333|nr:HEAT repeat domain-containing protein [Enterobacter roggenkampii]MBK4125963.1 HEAT repeat domain-containing protein [Enterobacter roggenkampii]